MHRTPQFTPSQLAAPYALPFDGPGHGELHDVPQLLTAVLSAHVPPQSWVPEGQPHAPAWHVIPTGQAWADPQPPQLRVSDCSSTHPPAQAL